MDSRYLIAQASVNVKASREQVWKALVTPATLKQLMFGADVVSDWRKGSAIFWRGEWQGKAFEDKGVILQFEPARVLQFSHYSPLSGVADSPENYHTVTIELSARGNETAVTLRQDNNATEDERAHSETNWKMMLDTLKKIVEQ